MIGLCCHSQHHVMRLRCHSLLLPVWRIICRIILYVSLYITLYVRLVIIISSHYMLLFLQFLVCKQFKSNRKSWTEFHCNLWFCGNKIMLITNIKYDQLTSLYSINPKSYCVYHFPIDLEPNGHPFGSKPIEKW